MSKGSMAFNVFSLALFLVPGFGMLAIRTAPVDIVFILGFTVIYMAFWFGMFAMWYSIILIDFHYDYFRGTKPLLSREVRVILSARGIYGMGH